MGKKLPILLMQEDFEKLYNETLRLERLASDKRRPRIKEYRLAMVLAFEGGLRISEILGYKDKVPALTKEQIEPASIRIISGKGGKDRIVPRPKRMNEKAISMLPLKTSRRPLQKFITDLGHKVLNKHMTFHTLRHGFGSHLAGIGRPLHEIQMLMGHSRLDTTGIYLHANPVKAIQGARDSF